MINNKKSSKAVVIAVAGVALCLFAVVSFVFFQSVQANDVVMQKRNCNICREIPIKVNTIAHEEKDIYTDQYQKESGKMLSEWKKQRTYSTDSPLIVENAYGTYSTALYYYAKTSTPSYVVCTLESEGASTLRHTLVSEGNEKLVTEHEYNIIGLVPGKENNIRLEFFDGKEQKIDDVMFSYVPKEDKTIPDVIEVHNGENQLEMSDGLYALLGHDKSEAANVYLFDNEGKARGRIPLNGYRTDRLLFDGDQMIYSYDTNKIAFQNRLGKIVKTMEMTGYTFHHDFVYDANKDALVILANKEGADTIEDRIVSVDCKTGDVKELVDFEKLMPEFRKSAIQRTDGKNTYGGTELDWIHFNSLNFVRDDQLILSSREHSSLIKIKDLYKKPSIDYIIHSGSLYKGTQYEKYQLQKKGDFVGQAGQHTITVERDDSLPEYQYYLYMFNNNFGNAATIPSFDWTLYPGVGQFAKGDHSSYYKYLVDEKQGTYELVNSFDLPYSSIVSSVQQMGDCVSFSSGMSKCFGEYDKNGKMIRTFYYDADKYSYRVMKYDFKGFYYC